MSWKENRLSNLSIQVVLNILEEENVDPSRCLEGTGLQLADILNISTKISTTTEVDIIHRALSNLPDKAGYGIRAGQALRITTFGVWGLAILSSPTWREAFTTMANFGELSSLLSRVGLIEENETVRFNVEMSHLPTTTHKFVFERYYAGLTTFIREMVPGFDFSGIKLEIPLVNEQYARDLADITGREVSVGCPAYALSTDSAWLDLPLPQADPLTHAHFVAQCSLLLNKHRELPNFSSLVRDYMLQNNEYSPRLEDVARKEGISSRSLRRRLSEEKTTFSRVVLESKMTLGKELIETTKLSVSSVAHRLNYSESASFTRAYTQWWGQPPSIARKATKPH